MAGSSEAERSAYNRLSEGSSPSWPHCIEPETNFKIFANGIQCAIGDVTEETLSCLENFARASPAFVALLSSGLQGIEAMPADEFVEVSNAGAQQYACMTEEELLRVQEAATAAMQ